MAQLSLSLVLLATLACAPREAPSLPAPPLEAPGTEAARVEPASESPAVRRGTPDGRVETIAALEGDWLVFGGQNLVAEAGVLLWRVGEESGDYLLLAPWRVDPETGQALPLLQEGVYGHDVTAQWLPGGTEIAVNVGREIQILDAAGRLLRRIPMPGSPSWAVSMAVNPRDGRIAAFEGTGGPRAGLAAWSPRGELLARIEDASGIPESDGFTLPFHPVWLPDGRLAFARPAGTPGTPGYTSMDRRLALADLSKGTVTVTPVEIREIQHVSPEGLLLLDGNRLYDPADGTVQPLKVEGDVPLRYGFFSKDGRWLGAARGEEVGILDRKDGTWRPLGLGRPLGWPPDGESLYWYDDPLLRG